MAKRKSIRIAGLGPIPMPTTGQDWLITIGTGVAGYYLIAKPILQKLGILKSSEQLKREREEREQLIKDSAAIYKSQTPTKTDTEWSQIAGVIWQSLAFSAIADNKSKAAYELQRPKNDADVWKLIEKFGIRKECWFGINCKDQNLPQFVSKNFSQSTINTINNNYMRKGIKYRW